MRNLPGITLSLTKIDTDAIATFIKTTRVSGVGSRITFNKVYQSEDFSGAYDTKMASVKTRDPIVGRNPFAIWPMAPSVTSQSVDGANPVSLKHVLLMASRGDRPLTTQ